MTPEKLAAALGISAKTLRAWLRRKFPRRVGDKGTPWRLLPQHIAAAKGRWDGRGRTRGTSLDEFQAIISASVEELDKEGTLCNYAAFRGTNKQLEAAWADGLVDQLRPMFVSKARRKRDGLLPDLFVWLEDESRLWCEIKPAWKHWYSHRCTRESNPRMEQNFFDYLYGRHRDDSVAADLVKLAGVSSNTAEYVGMLLIGFDLVGGLMEDDVDVLTSLPEFREQEWRPSEPKWWLDARCSDYRIGCWFWWQATRPRQAIS